MRLRLKQSFTLTADELALIDRQLYNFRYDEKEPEEKQIKALYERIIDANGLMFSVYDYPSWQGGKRLNMAQVRLGCLRCVAHLNKRLQEGLPVANILYSAMSYVAPWQRITQAAFELVDGSETVCIIIDGGMIEQILITSEVDCVIIDRDVLPEERGLERGFVTTLSKIEDIEKEINQAQSDIDQHTFTEKHSR